jgi:2-polyprenyl-6-hydroxyphenyl methylase/3-demethylubiquinone-9 3-methyltransferase
LRDLDILDIGCGGGLLCEPLARLGARVMGIDAATESVAAADAHARQGGVAVEYRMATPETLAESGRLFDVVINMEVVEHVDDVDAFLAASGRLVRPGGIMLLSTLNRTLKSLALAKIGAEYVLRWVPPGTHDWRRFVRPSELARGLRRQGLTMTALNGLSYAPAEDSWQLTDDLAVNYLAMAVKDGGVATA